MKKQIVFALVFLCANFSSMHAAPLVVDLDVDGQKDFSQAYEGSLAVPGTGEEFVDMYNKYADFIRKHGVKKAHSQDFHSKKNMSLASNWLENDEPAEAFKVLGSLQNPKSLHPYNNPNPNQMLWPNHCIQGTAGVTFFSVVYPDEIIVPKGMNDNYDSYSAFEDDGGHATEMEERLKQIKATTLIAKGLATDYCVKASVIDARKAGFNVRLLLPLCRGIDAQNSINAIKEMSDLGVEVDYVTELDVQDNTKQIRDLQSLGVKVNIFKTAEEHLYEVVKTDAAQLAEKSPETIWADNAALATKLLLLKAKQQH